MPEASLIFRAREEGSVEAIAARQEAALARVGGAAAKAAKDIRSSISQMAVSAQAIANPYAKAAEQIERAGGALSRSHAGLARSSADARLSIERTKAALGAMTQTFGNLNPQVAYGAIEIGRFANMLRGIGPAGMAAATGIALVTTAIAGTIAHAEALDKIEARFQAINRAARGLDAGALRSMVSQSTEELENLERRSGKFVTRWLDRGAGAARYGVNLGVDALNWLGADVKRWLSPEEEAAEARKSATGALVEKILPMEREVAGAAHTGAMATLGVQERMQALQRLAARGELDPERMAALRAGMRGLLEQAAQAEETQLWTQWRQAEAAAERAGTYHAEKYDLADRFMKARDQIYARLNNQIEAMEEQARQAGATSAGHTESLRATLSGYAIESRAARAGSLAARAAETAGSGDPYWRRRALQEDLALERERVDEWERVELDKLEKLNAGEEALGRVKQLAEEKRTLAMEDTLRKERELDRVVRSELPAALEAAGRTAREELGGAFDELAAKAAGISMSGLSGGWPSGATSAAGVVVSGITGRYAETDRQAALERMARLAREYGVAIPENEQKEYLDLERRRESTSHLEERWRQRGNDEFYRQSDIRGIVNAADLARREANADYARRLVWDLRMQRDTAAWEAGVYGLTPSGGLNTTIGNVDYGEPRAGGGPVQPGVTYIGGEMGPEPFVSGSPGYVLSHQEARGIYQEAVGGGAGITININVDGTRDARALAKELAKHIDHELGMMAGHGVLASRILQAGRYR